jgi:hypothetical protein
VGHSYVRADKYNFVAKTKLEEEVVVHICLSLDEEV